MNVVVGREAREFVPVVIDGIDARVVRALQIARELEIVGRVGEDEIDGSRRQLRHPGDAIADKNAMRLRDSLKLHGAPDEGAPRRDTTMTSGL